MRYDKLDLVQALNEVGRPLIMAFYKKYGVMPHIQFAIIEQRFSDGSTRVTNSGFEAFIDVKM